MGGKSTNLEGLTLLSPSASFHHKETSMSYPIIFFLGIALFAGAAAYDAIKVKDRVMGVLISAGVGCTLFGLVMSVTQLLSG